MKKKGTFPQAITDILVKHQVLSAKQGSEVGKLFKDSEHEYFEEFLIGEGFADDVNVLRALGQYYQVPAVDVVGHFFEHDLLHQFPKEFLLQNGMVPLLVDEDTLVMIVADPADQELLPKIGQFVSYDIAFNVGLRRHICDAVKEFYDESLTQEERDESMEEKARRKQEELEMERGLDIETHDRGDFD
jgi:hypothetical protein